MDLVTLLLVGIFGSAFLVFYSYLLGLFLLPLVVLLLCAVLIICYEGLGALIEANPAWLEYFGYFLGYIIAIWLFSKTKIYKRMNDWLIEKIARMY
ncbi:hypothetical protein [uncultured Parasutterella sp.]|uniref:hypothetical protein n=1 Tax=uncultured Parasutterella sp. TaxID=1263098 RepID=UPI002597C048|nr:hypothetical protein [uncultured Parasutterella sp.]